MADGLAWDDLTPELEGPGVGIRRMDTGGLAMCLIRLDAGLRTDPLFAGLPDDRGGSHRRRVCRDHTIRGLRRADDALQARHVGLTGHRSEIDSASVLLSVGRR